MSIQKSSWKIKQLLSLHRKTQTLDESGEEFNNISLVKPKQSLNTPRRLSWRLSQKPAETSLSPLRRTSSNTTTKSRQQPSTTESAYSSQSSLCSCECETNPESISYSLFRTPPLPDPFEILYHPPLSPSSVVGDAKTWRLIFSEPKTSRSRSLSKCGDTSSSEDTIRVSRLEPQKQESAATEDREKTPRHSIELVEDMEKDTLSDDVDQLIKETDEAFKAVGNALADAKAATKGGWYEVPSSTPTSRNEKRNNPITPPPKSSPSPRGISKKPSRSQLLPSPRLVTSSSTPKRNPSVTASKKKSKGVFGRALRGRKTPPPRPSSRTSTPPRWNLTDVTTNVVDVFSGKIFRTEVDEMLTPGRLQQIRKDMKLETQRKNSTDSGLSIETTGSDTPTEPFHLESLSLRIDAANSFTRLRPAPFPPEPILPSPPPTKQEKGVLEKKPRVKFSDPEITDERMLIVDLQFPCPPSPLPASPRGPARRPHPIKEVPVLPTIPEVSPITLSLKPPLPSTLAAIHPSPSSSEDEEEDDGIISLPSTPFTITSPMFKHGPIRFSRSLLEAKRREAMLEAKYDSLNTVREESEPLDWTAFEMAIQGTMYLPDDEVLHLGSSMSGIGGFGGDIKGKGVLRERLCGVEDGDDYFEWWMGFKLGPVGGIDTRVSSPWDGSASSGILELEADLTDGVVERDAKLLDVNDFNFPEVWASPTETRKGEVRHKVKGEQLEKGDVRTEDETPPPIPPRLRPRERGTRPFSFQLSPAGSGEFSIVSKGSGDYSVHSKDWSVSSMDTSTPSTLRHTPHTSTSKYPQNPFNFAIPMDDRKSSQSNHTPSHLYLTAHTPNNSTNAAYLDSQPLATPTQTSYAKPMVNPTFARPMDTATSSASFPMSPMPLLTGVGSEVVMGSNLHHDLGDFLSWESQFVPLGEEEEDLYGA